MGTLDDIGLVLCEIRELLRQLRDLQGGAPGPFPETIGGRRYVLATSWVVIDHVGFPPVLVARANPRRLAVAIGCLGPGDIFVSSDPTSRQGFPIFAGMDLGWEPVTEEIWATTNATGSSGTTVCVGEVVPL